MSLALGPGRWALRMKRRGPAFAGAVGLGAPAEEWKGRREGGGGDARERGMGLGGGGGQGVERGGHWGGKSGDRGGGGGRRLQRNGGEGVGDNGASSFSGWTTCQRSACRAPPAAGHWRGEGPPGGGGGGAIHLAIDGGTPP